MTRAIAALLLTLSAPAAARDIMVAPDGSGDYRTYAKALEVAVAGDVILIKNAPGMVGAIMKEDKGAILVYGTMPGSAAEKAGLKKGDRVVAVDGVDISSKPLADVIGMIRGPAGKTVTLRVAGEGGEREVPIVRGASRREVRDDLSKAQIAFEQKDFETAAVFARKGAERGVPAAQYFLANMFLNGTGVREDASQAFYWVTKAAPAGNADAQRLMAILYQHGAGAPKDLNMAVYWFRKAVDNKDAYSMYLLGQAYEDGKGVSVDPPGALKLYRRALATGGLPEKVIADAQRRAESLEAAGEGK